MRQINGFMTTVGVATALLATSLNAQDQVFVKQAAVAKTSPDVKKVQVIAAPVKGAVTVVREVMPPGADANLAPLIQQIMPQCRPILRAELHLVTSLCAPTKEQREKIIKEGERVLMEAVTKFAEAQNRMQQRQWRGEAIPDPRQLIQEGLPTALKSILTPEQITKYRTEIEKRTLDKKQIEVRSLVARLDQSLVLTKDQRAKLVDSLTANWNDSWGRSLDQFLSMYGDQYLPIIPDRAILPVLNELQKKVYQGTQKIQVNFFGNNFQGGNMIFMEEEALDAPIVVEVPGAAPVAEVRKDAVKKQEITK